MMGMIITARVGACGDSGQKRKERVGEIAGGLCAPRRPVRASWQYAMYGGTICVGRRPRANRIDPRLPF
jgi:hypothetical protein